MTENTEIENKIIAAAMMGDVISLKPLLRGLTPLIKIFLISKKQLTLTRPIGLL